MAGAATASCFSSRAAFAVDTGLRVPAAAGRPGAGPGSDPALAGAGGLSATEGGASTVMP